MKLSRNLLYRTIFWSSIIAFFIIYNSQFSDIKWDISISGSLIIIAFFACVIYFSYAILNNLSIFLTRLINNHRSNNELVDEMQHGQLYRLALPLLNETKYVNRSEIIRCEADNSYTVFHLIGAEKIIVSKPLKMYSDLLIPEGFIRTHQSHLVNPKFVKSWLKEDGGVLLLTSGDKIPISKPNKEIVKHTLQQL